MTYARDELESLAWHWGTAYRFRFRLGTWRAQRRDDGRTLRARDPSELLAKIRTDYARKPVPR